MSGKKPWWHSFPTYADIHDIERLKRLNIRISPSGSGDPGWGPIGQWLDNSDGPQRNAKIKETGSHPIAWLEGFGTCFIYAAAFRRRADGSFESIDEQKLKDFKAAMGDMMKDGDTIPKIIFNAWSWDKAGEHSFNAVRWVGPHNVVNDEDIVQGSMFSRERYGMETPHYPDGRPAVGHVEGQQYPLSACFYDAVCSKDINGAIDRFGEGLGIPKKANTIDPNTGKPEGCIEGLYKLVIGENEKAYLPQYNIGDTIYLSIIGIGKDPAAPFWRDYYRFSARNSARAGLMGVWCDNYSPFNNFGFMPIQNGFGEWSVARFRDYLQSRFTKEQLASLGIEDVSSFDIREYLKSKALEFGAQNPSHYLDKAWTDPRWLDDVIWCAYKVFKQQMGQEGLRNLYASVKSEAAKNGCDEFCIMGNDMPWSMGWVREDYLDMVSAELSPGWSILGGSRGIMLPPHGKMAVMYCAAREHAKAPYATFWYYLTDEKYQNNPGLSKVLFAEAFANAAFIKYGDHPQYPGNDESVAWWNAFVVSHESTFGSREEIADVGIYFSVDNQLALVPPGYFTLNHDRQPHMFGHWGFATAMIDAHIPYKVVMDWKFGEKALQGLKTFIMPDAECLDDEVLPVLEKWVSSGGRLVITGASGMRRSVKGLFERRESSLLDPLLSGGKIKGFGSDGINSGKMEIFVSDATDIRTLKEEDKKHIDTADFANAEIIAAQYGKGTVIYTPASLGMEYYLREKERESILPNILKLTGPSELFEAGNLPVSVGAFTWRSSDNNAVFVDLVNYNIDIDADTVTPARDLSFRLKLPENMQNKKLSVTTLSPDPLCRAYIEDMIRDGWASLAINTLEHFASIKIEANKMSSGLQNRCFMRKIQPK